ncbi:MAG: hypothetical protein HKO53_06745, partial [Gemmatimonadetes bacterium]|nr:hypothetical protein [Gemmatimonadota bacterium]
MRVDPASFLVPISPIRRTTWSTSRWASRCWPAKESDSPSIPWFPWGTGGCTATSSGRSAWRFFDRVVQQTLIHSPRRIQRARGVALLAAGALTLSACGPGESSQGTDRPPEAAVNAPSEEVSRWEARAANVTIIRDDWGIAHVYGQTDADAVFGMVYAQAEDDFNRIEVNFLNSQGRLAEAEGE